MKYLSFSLHKNGKSVLVKKWKEQGRCSNKIKHRNTYYNEGNEGCLNLSKSFIYARGCLHKICLGRNIFSSMSTSCNRLHEVHEIETKSGCYFIAVILTEIRVIECSGDRMFTLARNDVIRKDTFAHVQMIKVNERRVTAIVFCGITTAI